MNLIALTGLLAFVSTFSFASVPIAPAQGPGSAPVEILASFERALTEQARISRKKLLANVAPAGTAPGVVVASPSRSEPDYFYHWVRDAALVMDALITLHEGSSSKELRETYMKHLLDFVDFSRRNQLTYNPSGGPSDTGLGEPKFRVDGSPYNESWGRPQNDGPAIRAYALTRLAHLLLKEGRSEYVRKKLYDSAIPTHSVIKADLEYVAHHWRDSSFDLWEEVRGQHFYTRMVQRRALVEGADLAQRLGDSGAADYYRSQARALEKHIDNHWNGGLGYVQATLDPENGNRGKDLNLDVAVVLGALHGDTGDGFYGVTSDRVFATAAKLAEAFRELYSINPREGLGVAIGRYPEDTYDGYRTDGKGNPWVLATAAFAELCYRAQKELKSAGRLQITRSNAEFFREIVGGSGVLRTGEQLRAGDKRFGKLLEALKERGDTYMKRVLAHANPDGSLSEQIHRSSGRMQGAPDLTWSHASYLTALISRERL